MKTEINNTKRLCIPHFWSDKAFNSAVVNQALHWGSLEITLTVPLNPNPLVGFISTTNDEAHLARHSLNIRLVYFSKHDTFLGQEPGFNMDKG